jgi:hypothetical protein
MRGDIRNGESAGEMGKREGGRTVIHVMIDYEGHEVQQLVRLHVT